MLPLRWGAEAARRTREVLEQARFQREGSLRDTAPFIAVLVDDSEITSSMRRIQNPGRLPYHLMPVGDRDTSYSYENVYLPQLEDVARRINYAHYGLFEKGATDSEESRRNADIPFDSIEPGRKSLWASAAFLKYDLHAFCCRIYRDSIAIDVRLPAQKDWTKPLDDPAFDDVLDAYAQYVEDEANRTWLNELEHQRWVSYLHTEGFRAATEEEFEKFRPITGMNHHPIACLHACLLPYEELRAVGRVMDEVEGDATLYEQRADDSIRHLQRIARG